MKLTVPSLNINEKAGFDDGFRIWYSNISDFFTD